MPDLVVAGAGMAGLAAAARARELGADVTVLEKGDRAGGSMLLSSGVIWRYREWERFRAECPGGDPALQRVVWERLDDDLGWLASLGAQPSVVDTGNPDTAGARFDTRELTQSLVTRAGEIRLREPLTELPEGVPVVLATGGFQGDRGLVADHITPEANIVLRSNPAACTRAGRSALPGDGRVLREKSGGCASDHRGGVRAARPGLRAECARGEPRG